MAEELQLATLGHLRIRRDGIPVTGFDSNKVQALLCYLAVTGLPHLRPALAGLLWGELPKASAQNSLRRALTNLRQLVGPYVTITRQRVAFERESAHWFDVAALEALVEGASNPASGARPSIEHLEGIVDLYQGDFTAGFYVRQAPAFEQWVLAQQARLHQRAVQALHTDHVLQANDDPRAGTVLEEANQLLHAIAAKITDEDLRGSFLENMAAHREIVAERASHPSPAGRNH